MKTKSSNWFSFCLWAFILSFVAAVFAGIWQNSMGAAWLPNHPGHRLRTLLEYVKVYGSYAWFGFGIAAIVFGLKRRGERKAEEAERLARREEWRPTGKCATGRQTGRGRQRMCRIPRSLLPLANSLAPDDAVIRRDSMPVLSVVTPVPSDGPRCVCRAPSTPAQAQVTLLRIRRPANSR